MTAAAAARPCEQLDPGGETRELRKLGEVEGIRRNWQRLPGRDKRNTQRRAAGNLVQWRRAVPLGVPK